MSEVSSQFQCYVCSKCFPTPAALREHVEDHSTTKALRCGFCDASFHELTALLSHISSAHGGLPFLYTCSYCKLAFQALQSLEDHAAVCQGRVLLDSKDASFSAAGSFNLDAENISEGTDIRGQGSVEDGSGDAASRAQQSKTSISLQGVRPGLKQRSTTSQVDLSGPDSNFAVEYVKVRLAKKIQAESGSTGVSLLQNVNSYQNGADVKCGAGSVTHLRHVGSFYTESAANNSNKADSPFTCKVCLLTLESREDLLAHISSHGMEECYMLQCVKCNRCFDTMSLLEAHLKNTECSGFMCTLCGKSFGMEGQLLKHRVLIHKPAGGVSLSCSQCSKKCRHLKSRARHEATHAKSLPYLCKICGKALATIDKMRITHLPKAHKLTYKKKFERGKKNNEDDDDVNETGTEGDLDDGEKGISEGNVRREQVMVLPNPLDVKPLQNVNVIYRNTNTQESSPFTCNVCSLVCDDLENLSVHVSTHYMNECYTIKCVQCNLVFANLDMLEKHLEDAGCPGFVCDSCGRSFGLETSLLKHKVLVHKKASLPCKMECGQCGKTYPNIASWGRHEATHSVSLPYACKLCGKHFANLEQIKVHHLPNAHNVTYNLRLRVKWVPGNNGKKDKVSMMQATRRKKKRETSLFKTRVCIDCDICGGKVSDQHTLAVHKAHHFMEGKYSIQCSGCPETFGQMSDLMAHAEQRRCPQYGCSDCHRTFPTQLSFVVHRLQVHTLPPVSGMYTCPDCHKTYDTQSSFLEHAAEHVTSKPFQCRICSEHFISMELLENHLNETHTLIRADKGESLFPCSSCLGTFRTRHAVNVHRRFFVSRKKLLENKEDINKPDSNFTPYMTPYFCQVCSVGFGSAYHLEEHEQMHSAEGMSSKCSVCNKNFSPSFLKQHVAIHKQTSLCTICGKTLCKSRLSNHMLACHSEVNPFQCKYCNKSLSSKASLRLHLRIHTGYKPFECKACGKAFALASQLESHMVVHAKGRLYQCKVCSQQFRHKQSLANHMDIHNGIKHFRCSLCGKTFRQSQQLKYHQTIHTGEKNFSCHICGKKFARKNYLDIHTLIHTKEKPFSCPFCGISVAVASNLNVHVKKVHGEDAYKQFQEEKKRRRAQEVLRKYPVAQLQ